MICRQKDCRRPADKHTGDCKVHSSGLSVTVNYHEWDEALWYERRELLRKMWKAEAAPDGKRELIGDLIMHAHDLNE